MRKRFSVLLMTVAVVSGCVGLAQAVARAEASGGATLAGADQAAPPPSTTLRMDGTLDKYNRSTGVLSLSTSTGIVQFPIASTTRIRQRREKIEAIALEKLAGYRVAIRYAESGGHKTVESIRVFGKEERTTR